MFETNKETELLIKEDIDYIRHGARVFLKEKSFNAVYEFTRGYISQKENADSIDINAVMQALLLK